MLKALASGVAGAVALTAIHETARRTIPHAPRMDVIGMRGIRRPVQATGHQPPRGRNLRRMALAGELASNSLFYSLVGLGDDRHALRRGAILGLAAGLGAALLPPVLGLGNQPGRRTPVTQILTVLWYFLGGLAAAGALRAADRWEE